jgi:tetratricopeptide (TPR) repeat protein
LKIPESRLLEDSEELHHTILLRLRGSCYQSLADWDKALSDYNKCLEIDPQSQVIIEGMPNNVIVLNNIGQMYAEQGNFEEAVKYTRKAIDLPSPIQSFTTYINLSTILHKIGKKEEAYRISDEVLSKAPNPMANEQRGTLHYLDEQYEKAVTYLTGLQ